MIGALVGASVSLLIFFLTPFSTRFVERAKVSLQKDLEDHKKEIAKEISESNSRLSYEFDARKRLYSQVEPILFQLYEASEGAYSRVASLVRTYRNNNLMGEEGWLAHEGYYMKSTIYLLFLPAALFRNLQRAATFIDLRLDESIRIRYFLLKWSYLCFTDDFLLARQQPQLKNEPEAGENPDIWYTNPPVYSKQGIVLGYLEDLTEAMIATDGNVRRVLTFGEFQTKIRDEEFQAHFRPMLDVFHNFNFIARPILARLLFAQALLHRLILHSYTCEVDVPELRRALHRFVETDECKNDLRWWQAEENSLIDPVLAYLDERLNWTAKDDYTIN